MAKGKHCYEYPRPAVTVDIAAFRARGGVSEVLLVKRKKPPFKGSWVLPGGFIEMHETLEESARRELAEETGLRRLSRLRPFGTYGNPGRDPRGRTITVAFIAVVPETRSAACAGDDAADARWFRIRRLPRSLGFDHARIVRDAIRHYRSEAP